MPAVQERLSDDLVHVDGQDFRVTIDGSADDASATVDFHIRVVRPDDQPLCVVNMRGTVTNPLEFGVEIVGAASAFALCVAVQAAGTVGGMAYASYAASRKEKPDLNSGARCGDLFSRMLARAQDFRDSAAGILTGCAAQTAIGS